MKMSKRIVAAAVAAATVCALALSPMVTWAEDDGTAVVELQVEDDQPISTDALADEEAEGYRELPAGEEGDDWQGEEGDDWQDDEVDDQQEPDPDSNELSGMVVLDPADTPAANAHNLQNAFAQASGYTGEGQFQVVLRSGVYEIDRGLSIPSNTRLVLEDGAVIKRADSSSGISLFRVGGNGTDTDGYNLASNVTISGGVWDNANHTTGKMLRFKRCHDITIENAVFQRSRADHVILLDGVKGVMISGCTFSDCVSDARWHAAARYVNEAIHIDSTMGSAPNDDVGHTGGQPSCDITVDGCTFDGVCCAVGAHYHGEGDPVQHNITVTNNTVKQVESGSTSFTAANTEGWTVRNNTAKNCGAGYFARLNGCKGFVIANNVVDDIDSFVVDNGSANGLRSSGTLSGNVVTGIASLGFRSFGVASTYTLDGESYTTTRTEIPESHVNYFFVYIEGRGTAKPTATIKNCTFKYAHDEFSAGTAYINTLKFVQGRFTITNNTITNAPFAGIYLQEASSGSTVSGNKLTSCGGAGTGVLTNAFTIVINKTSGCSVTNNTLKDCKQGGIYLTMSKGNTVKNNTIETAQDTDEVRQWPPPHFGFENTISNNGPIFKGATSMPVGSTATYSLSGGSLSSSNKGVVSVSGKTLTARKVGSSTITLTYNGRTYTKVVTVTSIHGIVYEMESVVNKDFVLDVQKGSTDNGARILVWERKGGNNTNQRYQLYRQPDDTYAIRSVKSRKWLDVKGGSGDNSTPVIQWSWTGGENQRWNITVDAQNKLTFVNVKSGKCLDIQGGKAQKGKAIIQYTSNNGKNQKWVLRQR